MWAGNQVGNGSVAGRRGQLMPTKRPLGTIQSAQKSRTERLLRNCRVRFLLQKEEVPHPSSSLKSWPLTLHASSPLKKPVHRILLGSNSIRLPFPSRDQPSLFSPSPYMYRAALSVHLADHLTEDGLDTLSTGLQLSTLRLVSLSIRSTKQIWLGIL